MPSDTPYVPSGMNRRAFLTAAVGTAVAMTIPSFTAAAASGPLTLPPLPYAQNALGPVISARTIEFHYGKHHAGYLNALNKLIAGTKYEKMSLEDIVKSTAGKQDATAIFNNAAQTWNHSFYWQCLTPKGGGTPPLKLKEKIEASFKDVSSFTSDFVQAATKRFGSGWAWLVEEGEVLKIVTTPNAETPLTTNAKPILVVDVWEHAYYLDYQNLRADYVKAVMEKLINWEFAAKNLG